MDKQFMLEAIEEAKKGYGQTYTNPLVGAVIVKDNRIIARGSHLSFGDNHAERNAIKNCQAPEELIDSTLYVTLEPCSHYGKQPPCTQLIKNSGISQVIIGQLDSNPLVAGQGKRILEEHGIEVIVGIEELAVRQLNKHYNFFHEQKRPYIVLKQATTLDGRLTTSRQERMQVTGQTVWEQVHRERSNYQSILIGSQTALTDNPTLLPLKVGKYPPVRIVLDRRGRTLTQKELALFKSKLAPVWIYTENTDTDIDLPDHVHVIQLINMQLMSVLHDLAERKIQSVYVEGGATIHDAFLNNDCWEESITYISPKLLGGKSISSFDSERIPTQVTRLKDVTVKQVGEDIRIQGRHDKCLQV